MNAQILKRCGVALALGASTLWAGCGEYVRSSRSPSQIVIESIEAASGVDENTFFTFLLSDVVTNIEDNDGNPIATIFNDPGRVTMRIILRDPGVPGVGAEPSPLNEVTITRYRVVYRRADGRNTPGVDVPFPFDGAATFTIPAGSNVTHGFNLVRHIAKKEAPLAALANQPTIITTIAEVTFYGRDGAGNEISATAAINIEFGNFADPD